MANRVVQVYLAQPATADSGEGIHFARSIKTPPGVELRFLFRHVVEGGPETLFNSIANCDVVVADFTPTLHSGSGPDPSVVLEATVARFGPRPRPIVALSQQPMALPFLWRQLPHVGGIRRVSLADGMDAAAHHTGMAVSEITLQPQPPGAPPRRWTGRSFDIYVSQSLQRGDGRPGAAGFDFAQVFSTLRSVTPRLEGGLKARLALIPRSQESVQVWHRIASAISASACMVIDLTPDGSSGDYAPPDVLTELAMGAYVYGMPLVPIIQRDYPLPEPLMQFRPLVYSRDDMPGLGEALLPRLQEAVATAQTAGSTSTSTAAGPPPAAAPADAGTTDPAGADIPPPPPPDAEYSDEWDRPGPLELARMKRRTERMQRARRAAAEVAMEAGERSFDLFRDAVKLRDWPAAMEAYQQAIREDPWTQAMFNPEKFQVDMVLGAGPSGVVFRGTIPPADDFMLPKKVIIKALIDPGVLQQDADQLFNNLETLGRARGGGVLPVEGWDRYPRGEPTAFWHFWSPDQEGAAGLQELVALSGSLSEGDTAAVAVGIVRGLMTADAVRLPHLALRPSNVLVSTDGSWKVWLRDFGFVPDFEHDDIAGDPQWLPLLQYAAPEQLGDAPGTPGRPADVYALGRVMLFCLTGVPDVTPRRMQSIEDPRLRHAIEGCLREDPRTRWPGYDPLLELLEQVAITARELETGAREAEDAPAGAATDDGETVFLESPDATAAGFGMESAVASPQIQADGDEVVIEEYGGGFGIGAGSVNPATESGFMDELELVEEGDENKPTDAGSDFVRHDGAAAAAATGDDDDSASASGSGVSKAPKVPEYIDSSLLGVLAGQVQEDGELMDLVAGFDESPAALFDEPPLEPRTIEPPQWSPGRKKQLICGIDLGTCTSLLSYVDDMGDFKVVHHTQDSVVTPSVVYFPQQFDCEVGIDAKRMAVIEPENCAQFFKLNMGDSRRAREFHSTKYTPEMLASLVLRRLVDQAVEEMGGEEAVEVRDVVISVPSSWDDARRQSTRLAAEMAGLNVLGTLSEPVAVSLEVALKYLRDGKTVFVYDFGGGTFDVTIFRLENHTVRLLANMGLPTLGGKDLDEKLLEYVVWRFHDEFDGEEVPDPLERPENRWRLLDRCEQVKIALCRKAPPQTIQVAAGGKNAKITISLEDFEYVIQEEIEKTRQFALAALLEAGLRPKEIDHVLLVGGSSQIPMVRRMLAEIFSEEAVAGRTVNPQETVARGACRNAADLWAHAVRAGEVPNEAVSPALLEKLGEAAVLREETPVALSVITQDGDDETPFVEVVVPQGSSWPAAGMISARTGKDHQRSVVCHLRWGAGPDPESTEELATVVFLLPAGAPRFTPLRFSVWFDGPDRLFAALWNGASRETQVKQVPWPGPSPRQIAGWHEIVHETRVLMDL